MDGWVNSLWRMARYQFCQETSNKCCHLVKQLKLEDLKCTGG